MGRGAWGRGGCLHTVCSYVQHCIMYHCTGWHLVIFIRELYNFGDLTFNSQLLLHFKILHVIGTRSQTFYLNIYEQYIQGDPKKRSSI